MKSCWLVINGQIDLPKFADFHQFLKHAGEKLNVSVSIKKNNELVPCIDNGLPRLVGCNERPDFVLFMDKDILLATHLENMGIRVFNSADAIEVCDNKIKTHLLLSKHGVPMPKTLFSPFIYERMTNEASPFLESLAFPFVLKEAHGSFGKQVYLIQNREELVEKVTEIGHRPFLIQELVHTSYGVDIRLNVVGNRVVAAMKRQSDTDFRANATLGGKLSPYTPSQEETDLALRAVQATGADFAGVDLLFGPDGPLVCEVNSNAHIVSIFETTGVNVATEIFSYCLEKIGEAVC